MKSSLRCIHFRCEWQIIGPQSPGQRFERQRFQSFFENLNSNVEFGDYDDFSYRLDHCELGKVRGMSHQGGQAFSKVIYKDDALKLVEEFTAYSIDEFARQIKVVLDAWFECFSETVLVVQNCWIRGLVTPLHSDDSRAFLSETVLGLREGFATRLNEAPLSVGFNFVSQRQYESVPMTLEAKVSSWRDGRSIWIEVHGGVPMSEPLNAARHDRAEAVFGRCRTFLESEVIPLLSDYDRKEHD